MNTNDTPRTTTVTPKQRRILGDLVWIHKITRHMDAPRPGCPSCVFGGAFEQPEGEGA
jgi:hypothetical protein